MRNCRQQLGGNIHERGPEGGWHRFGLGGLLPRCHTLWVCPGSALGGFTGTVHASESVTICLWEHYTAWSVECAECGIGLWCVSYAPAVIVGPAQGQASLRARAHVYDVVIVCSAGQVIRAHGGSRASARVGNGLLRECARAIAIWCACGLCLDRILGSAPQQSLREVHILDHPFVP